MMYIVSKVLNNFAHLLIVLFFLFGCKLVICCLFINSELDYSSYTSPLYFTLLQQSTDFFFVSV